MNLDYLKEGHPYGWRESTHINNLDKIISIYERFGGVKIN